MNTKLTLSIDKNIIEKAKIYAKKRNKSVSKLIENYLKNIEIKNENNSISPIVSELAGSIKNIADIKDDYTDYLIKKYK